MTLLVNFCSFVREPFGANRIWNGWGRILRLGPPLPRCDYKTISLAHIFQIPSPSHIPRFKQSTCAVGLQHLPSSSRDSILTCSINRFNFFRRNKHPAHKNHNPIPPSWGESRRSFQLLPSICHRQHHGDDEFDLNGHPANVFLFCSKEKMHINVVVIGHVDSGKSTTTGKR